MNFIHAEHFLANCSTRYLHSLVFSQVAVFPEPRHNTSETKEIKCNTDFSACPAAGGGAWVYVKRDVSRLLYVNSHG